MVKLANKKLAYLSLLVAGLEILDVIPAYAATCVAPAAGLVSWWSGDGNVNDIMGVNNPTAQHLVSLIPAKVLNGFNFSSGGYIQIPQSTSLENQKFTWVAWALPIGPNPDNGGLIINQDIDATHASVNLGWRASDQRFTFFSWIHPNRDVSFGTHVPVWEFLFSRGNIRWNYL